MSGRPQRPSTVKNRSPVTSRPYRWLYEWAMSSLAFFVAPYRDTGWSDRSSTENGTFRLAPYTELEEAKTRWRIRALTQPSKIFTNPSRLVLTYTMGFLSECLTPA